LRLLSFCMKFMTKVLEKKQRVKRGYGIWGIEEGVLTEGASYLKARPGNAWGVVGGRILPEK